MSPYIVLYIFVLVMLFISLINKKYVNVCYRLAFTAMTIFLCFRAGQGTDYPAYEWIYRLVPDTFSFTHEVYFSGTASAEYGWWILCNAAKSLGLSVHVFISLLGLFEMVLVNRFVGIFGNGRYKLLTLVIAFHTFYFTFMYSTLRQALCLSIFLGIMLPDFSKKRYLRYIATALILTVFIHRSSFILILLLVADLFKRKHFKVLLPASLVVGLGLNFAGGSLLRPLFVLVGKTSYLSHMGISYFAVLERLVMLAVVIYLYDFYIRDNHDKETKVLVKYYCLGVCFYLAFMAFPLVASRMGIFFKIVEILLIPRMIVSVGRPQQRMILSLIVVIATGMFLKNIGSALNEGDYLDSVNVYNYPYVTVFNAEDIYNYRESIYETANL